jgi:hypothetical protein
MINHGKLIPPFKCAIPVDAEINVTLFLPAKCCVRMLRKTGLTQAKVMAQGAGMTGSEQREGVPCLEKKMQRRGRATL